ncbi:hypothetical protein BAUCODRAFT_575921 [Baudoinia panamericana UAMH 10762]|uniref:Uncharacterized protein n=1 Tax=Baudoinia panamericana (strain UAMH 10762) TaxID=717646 RepID=M2MXH0_BAUPA|nr:uncharacterized protein BAUCODRAFT_575921 [Baudoinia panamericana UAMH 10762]EMC96263.1 hypothetical protein BAUCODRAFT_575921 [Baudoinia panamericana UAMH 10762]
MEASKDHLSLLGLPRELRDHIYNYVLTVTRKAPPGPFHAGQRTRGRYSIHYHVGSTGMDLPNIALTCHQIREEVLDHDQTHAELDIMIRAYLVIPTWIVLPAILKCRQPLNVTVNLRVFSPEGFHSNDGWPRQPGECFRALYCLLYEYFIAGPRFHCDRTLDPADIKYSIGILTVKLKSLDIYTPAVWPTVMRSILGKLKALASTGIVSGHVKTIRVYAEYHGSDGTCQIVEKEWQVASTLDKAASQLWRAQGFPPLHSFEHDGGDAEIFGIQP